MGSKTRRFGFRSSFLSSSSEIPLSSTLVSRTSAWPGKLFQSFRTKKGETLRLIVLEDIATITSVLITVHLNTLLWLYYFMCNFLSSIDSLYLSFFKLARFESSSMCTLWYPKYFLTLFRWKREIWIWLRTIWRTSLHVLVRDRFPLCAMINKKWWDSYMKDGTFFGIPWENFY